MQTRKESDKMFTIKDMIVGEIIECPTKDLASQILKERFNDYVDNGYYVEVKNLSTKVIEIKVIDKFIPIDQETCQKLKKVLKKVLTLKNIYGILVLSLGKESDIK